MNYYYNISILYYIEFLYINTLTIRVTALLIIGVYYRYSIYSDKIASRRLSKRPIYRFLHSFLIQLLFYYHYFCLELSIELLSISSLKSSIAKLIILKLNLLIVLDLFI